MSNSLHEVKIQAHSNWFSSTDVTKQNTHINHGIGGDAEQCGPLCHLTDLITSLSSQTQTVQF